MNERSGSDRPRDAFGVLVAARPEPPAELISPDTPAAADLFRRLLDDQGRHRAPATHRRQFSLAVGAAAAAAVIGILLTVPERGGPSSVGTTNTEAEASQAPEPQTPNAPAGISMTEWPAIEPAPIVGDADTARAALISTGGWGQNRTEITMVGENVSLRFARPARPGQPVGPMLENRFVDGQWYYFTPVNDSEPFWHSDPDDDERIAALPTPDVPRELLSTLSKLTEFEVIGTDFVGGVEAVQLRATSPRDIDPAVVPIGTLSPDTVIESFDLFVDSNLIVRRLELSFTEPWHDGAWVSVEFSDIGEPITIDAPRDVVEIDAQG
jgi:hypothetical protein